jgi:hypothetical protein
MSARGTKNFLGRIGRYNSCGWTDPITVQQVVQSDQWVTFEVQINISPNVPTATGNVSQVDVVIWFANEGEEPRIFSSDSFSLESTADTPRIIMFLPYRDESFADSVVMGPVWYDELIASKEFIDFP